MVLMDFAQDYSCVIQHEIQSHHWAHKQVTMHPFAIYKEVNNYVKEEGFVAISENKTEDTYAVSLFQEKMTNYLKTKYNNRDVE